MVMDNILTGCIILMVLAMTVLFINGVGFLRKTSHQKTVENNLERFKVYMEMDIEDKVIRKLELFISDVLKNYAIVNIELNSTFKHTEDTEAELSGTICQLVLDRMSPSFINLLQDVYSNDKIGEIIAEKVNVQVFAYLLQYTAENKK